MNRITRIIENEGKRQGDRILSRLLDESRSLAGWQMTMASYAVSAAGVVVALATIFSVVIGFLGVTEIRRTADDVNQLRRQAEQHVETIRQYAETAQQAVQTLSAILESADADHDRSEDDDPAGDDRRPSAPN